MNQVSAERLQGRRRTCIMHVDMDAFFVSVELRTRPELRGKPVIVGFPGERSVVLSGSYEARDFGVKSAMPMAVALRMCPQAVVIEPRHKLYYEVSGQLMAIFESITGLVEPLSVDEAFLDVTGALRRLGPPRGIGELIRRRVAAELGITASVGIAETKFVAKIASTRCKPDGLLLIGPDQTVPYLHSLPVGALWGVGAKTKEVLAKMGISTVADVAATPVSSLKKVLGATGEHVHQLAWGIDPRPVTPVRVEKSIGAEETFATDTDDDALLRRELLRLSHRTAGRLRSSGMVARTVALKLRFADFSTITRSRTVQTPVDSAQLLYAVALQLLESVGTRATAVRLVGVRAEQLEEAARTSLQLSIDRRDDNWRMAEQVLDQVALKFGDKSVLPARLMEPGNRPDGSTERPA
ncbi:DNA polymerase IV [Pseudarthrobacter niigatensis]|uniref:DNA polymerase IV n=1 Tax=Pseudarthrobacter niigatensis TaxID=369935 RepID=A0AAJ1SUK8_9MICC|nr:DNA polymerase IV [Pseudarthrobacter niigatensis]MDQ0147560.1 DNA polymerase-4 [Pseudarthrobacter niigatensis]MDQ0267501.1 DNA polymerase-4 [Pseudarthrobacter niigatensis]